LRKFLLVSLLVTMLSTMLLTLTACGSRHEAVRHCVDGNGNVTEDKNCANPSADPKHKYAWVYAPAGGPNEQ
jgi:hypothetical protein